MAKRREVSDSAISSARAEGGTSRGVRPAPSPRTTVVEHQRMDAMTIEQRTLAGTAPSPPSAGPVNRRSRIVPWVGAIGLVAAGSGAVL